MRHLVEGVTPPIPASNPPVNMTLPVPARTGGAACRGGTRPLSTVWGAVALQDGGWALTRSSNSSPEGSSAIKSSYLKTACHALATSTPSSFLPEGSGLGLGAGGTYSSDASKLTTEPAIPPPREPPVPARLVLDSPLKPTPPCIGNRIVSEKPLAMSSQ